MNDSKSNILAGTVITAIAGIIGAVVGGYFLFRANTETVNITIAATQTAEEKKALSTLQAQTWPIEQTPSITPLLPPRVYDFSACINPCDGNNRRDSFPEKIFAINFTWKYENIPVGAHYKSNWLQVDKSKNWATNECIWPGPTFGEENLRIFDDKGLSSGTWQVSVIVDNEVLLSERFFIEGNWNNPNIGGNFDTCYFGR